MATGNHHLRDLDGSRECQQRDGQKQKSARVAKTKSRTYRDKDEKMFKIMSGAGDRPGRGRTERQHHDGQDEQPGDNLKKSLRPERGKSRISPLEVNQMVRQTRQNPRIVISI